MEETLHLAGMQVDRYDVSDARDFEEVGDHAGGDGTAVGLFLRLTRVGKIWYDSFSVVSLDLELGHGRHMRCGKRSSDLNMLRTTDGFGRATLAGRYHDQKLHHIVVDPSLSDVTIAMFGDSTQAAYLSLPLCTMKTS